MPTINKIVSVLSNKNSRNHSPLPLATVVTIANWGHVSFKSQRKLSRMMEKHHRLAGQIQLGVAVLSFICTLAVIGVIFAIGSMNWSGTGYFKAISLVDFLGSFMGLLLVALAFAGVAHILCARSWLKGNQHTKFPLVAFAILQVFSLFLSPVGLYTLWALFRTPPAKGA